MELAATRSSVLVKSGYSGAAALRVFGADSQMLFAGDVQLQNGAELQVGADAAFGVQPALGGELEIASGATLHAGAAVAEHALSLDLQDVACAELAVQHLVLCGGSDYMQDGTYFTLSGELNSLQFDGVGEIAFSTTLDYLVTEDGLHRFLLFDGVEGRITISPSVYFTIDGYEGLQANVVRVGSAVYLQVIPEPATATLGLLALVALTARRRRQ